MALTTRVLKCDPSSISFPPSTASASLPTITCPDTARALEAASAQLVRNVQCVAFPTETVYGLGALALDASAAAKIFSTKGRPADNPLIVHVSSLPMLRTLLPRDYTLPQPYAALVKHFWPGALTLLFPCDAQIVPPIVTAGQKTVAVRMPSHPVARALIALADAPLAAPSANSSGKPSPTRAEHVVRDLEGRVAIVLDGGACGVGVESTVVDGLHPDGAIRVLRPGGVTVEDLERVLQEELGGEEVPRVLVHRRDYADEAIESAPTTPGMKYRHYSPAVPVQLIYTSGEGREAREWEDAQGFWESLRMPDRAVKVGILAQDDSSLGSCHPPGELHLERFSLGPSSDPAQAAHRLFDGLLTLERNGVDIILIEAVPEEKEGLAVMNRVKKAAGESRFVRFSV